MAKVVVALDVDEVLNADNNGGVVHSLAVKKEHLPKSPFILSKGEKDFEIQVTLVPAHGEWINSLLARGHEVVWATTWENAANVYLAPLLGIPSLPLGVSIKDHPPKFAWAKGGDSAAWKAHALGERYADPSTALVWVDDSAGRYDRDSTISTRDMLLAEGWTEEELAEMGPFYSYFIRSGPTLIVVPPTRTREGNRGLTDEHIADIEAWITKVSEL